MSRYKIVSGGLRCGKCGTPNVSGEIVKDGNRWSLELRHGCGLSKDVELSEDQAFTLILKSEAAKPENERGTDPYFQSTQCR